MMYILDRRRKKQPQGEVLTSAAPQEANAFLADGKRHHLAHIPYLLPVDTLENNRLDFQHHFLKSLLRTHYLAPVDPSILRTILDVGSGTGRWVNDIAQDFQHVHAIGLDIVLRQTSSLPNTLFLQGDILKGLPFESGRFDLTHQRLLVAAIPARNWPGAISEMKRVTCEGGWIELVEGGTTFEHAGPATKQFLSWWDQLSKRQGIDASLMAQLDTLLIRAGLKQVEKRILSAPLGSWGGHAGTMLATNTQTGWSSLKEQCLSLGVPSAQFDAVIAGLPDEWNQRHVRYEYYVTWGQVHHGK